MKKLFFLFIILLISMLVLRFWPDKKEVLEDLTIYNFPTTNIQQLQIIPPRASSFKLLKKEDKWYFQSGTNSCLADNNSVQGILSAIKNVKLKKIIPESGTAFNSPLELHFKTTTTDEEVLLYPVIQQKDSMLGYLQFKGNPEIFEIEPHLYWSLDLPENHFKDKLILDLDSDIVQQIYLESPDDTLTFTRRLSYWYLNQNLLDTIKQIDGWFERLKPVYGNEFAQEAPESHNTLLSFIDNRNRPFELYFYDAPDSTKILVRNNHNPAARFVMDTLFYEQVVHDLLQLVPPRDTTD